VRKQKTDRQDAQLLLRLLLEDRFPRIWVPNAENRDLRQLLWHRHRLVQMRTRVMNQLHVVALNEGRPPQESVVVAGRARPIGVLGAGPVGQPAKAGSAGVAGPTEPNHRGVRRRHCQRRGFLASD
jgi:transposase